MNTDEIKKEIIEEVEDYWSVIVSKLSIAERRFLNNRIILIRKETSKAKDKEFLEMIDILIEQENNLVKNLGDKFRREYVVNLLEELKQKLEEK